MEDLTKKTKKRAYETPQARLIYWERTSSMLATFSLEADIPWDEYESGDDGTLTDL